MSVHTSSDAEAGEQRQLIDTVGCRNVANRSHLKWLLIIVILCVVGAVVAIAVVLARHTRSPAASAAPISVVGPLVLLPRFKTNSNGHGRDGGLTVQLHPQDQLSTGAVLLWMFGDTFTSAGLRSTTAAWSTNLSTPWLIEEQIVAPPPNNAPLQFIPFTPEETLFNEQHFGHSDPCCSDQTNCPSSNLYCHCNATVSCVARYAIWPGAGIALNSSAALVSYELLTCGVAPWDFQQVGVGFAIASWNSTVADRMLMAGSLNEPLLVFGAQDPTFTTGMVVSNESTEYVYMYAGWNRGFFVEDTLAARVPLGLFANRSHYEFWADGSWSPDLSAASAMPGAKQIDSGLGSIIRIRLSSDLYLSAVIPFGSVNVHFRMAQSPVGPWSAETKVDLSSVGATSGCYAAELHTGLLGTVGVAAPPEGSSSPSTGPVATLWFVMSFFQPDEQNPFDGKVRMVNFTQVTIAL